MCELLQSGEQSGERAQAANSLSALLSGGSRKRAEVGTNELHWIALQYVLLQALSKLGN